MAIGRNGVECVYQEIGDDVVERFLIDRNVQRLGRCGPLEGNAAAVGFRAKDFGNFVENASGIAA